MDNGETENQMSLSQNEVGQYGAETLEAINQDVKHPSATDHCDASSDDSEVNPPLCDSTSDDEPNVRWDFETSDESSDED